MWFLIAIFLSLCMRIFLMRLKLILFVIVSSPEDWWAVPGGDQNYLKADTGAIILVTQWSGGAEDRSSGRCPGSGQENIWIEKIIITRTISNRQELIMSIRDRPPLIAGSLPFLTQIRNQVKDLFFQFNFRHALHDNKISGRISPGKLTSGDENYSNQNYLYLRLGDCSNLLTCACLMIVFINTSPDQSYCCVWSKLFISDNEWQWGVVTCWTLVTLLRPETWDCTGDMSGHWWDTMDRMFGHQLIVNIAWQGVVIRGWLLCMFTQYWKLIFCMIMLLLRGWRCTRKACDILENINSW